MSDGEPQPGMRELLEYWEWDTPARDSWCSVRCGNHDDRNASARVSVELGAYACMACDLKAGSPATLVMRVRGVSYREALDYLSTLGIQPVDSVEYSGKPWTKRSGQKFKQPWHRGRRTA